MLNFSTTAQLDEQIFVFLLASIYEKKDFEFTSSNKVTHIINCSGRQVENVFENIGIKYLVFNWMETDS